MKIYHQSLKRIMRAYLIKRLPRSSIHQPTNQSFEQLIALTIILSERNELRQSISVFQKSIINSNISEQDISSLIDVITIIISCAMRVGFVFDSNRKKDLLKANKLLSIIDEIKNELDDKLAVTMPQETMAQRRYMTYLRSIKSKILSICKLLNDLDTPKINQEASSIQHSLKHRQEYLVEQDDLPQLINTKVDSYYRVSQEYFYATSLAQQDIPESILNLNHSRFCQKKLRVPYLALSKYHDVQMRHQFIKSNDGWLSLDSQEELVTKDEESGILKNLRCLLKEFLIQYLDFEPKIFAKQNSSLKKKYREGKD